MKQGNLSVILLLFLGSISYSFAQSDCWSFMIGNTGFEKLEAMTTDLANNIYIAGDYAGTVDFDPSSATSSLTSPGYQEHFLASYDGDGNFRFVLPLPGMSINDIVANETGNIYYTGSYSGVDVDADPGPGVDLLPNLGSTNLYVASLQSDGTYRWSLASGSAGADEGRSISVDANGDVLATGTYFSTTDFDIGGSPTTLSSSGGTDIYVIKINDSGQAVWVKSIGGSGFEELPTLQASPSAHDGSWLSFGLQDIVSVDVVGVGIVDLSSNGDSDIGIIRMNDAGEILNATSIGGAERDLPCSMDVDPANNLYLTGTYRDSMDVDPSDTSAKILKSFGEADAYALSMDNSLSLRWAIDAGGPDYDDGPTIHLFDSGQSFTWTSSFGASISIQSGPTTTNTLNTNGFTDSFLSRHDAATGALKDLMQLGGTEADVGVQIGIFHGASNQNRVFVAGQSSGTIDLTPPWNVVCDSPMIHSSQGGFDWFLFSIPFVTDSSTSIVAEINPLSMKLFPNPAKEFLYLTSQDPRVYGQELQASLFDLQGKLMLEKELVGGMENQVSLKGVPKGLYLLQVLDQEGRMFVSKIVKKE